MFLSKPAITKQLFREFLNFKTLRLPPGEEAELMPGTLLGHQSPEADVGLGIEFAQRQLTAQLNTEEATDEERNEFHKLLRYLSQYKKASTVGDNPFTVYKKTEASIAYPCAWSIFAPLLIKSDTPLSYKTKDDFLKYIASPEIVFRFAKTTDVKNTGLFLAVKYNNPEMIDAFLCPELYGYHLTKDDLKKLLSLTNETKTRLALFRNSNELTHWIGEDPGLQVNCVLNFEELAGLWSTLSEEQRKEFINNTSSLLWLKLLDDDELGKQKIEKLLGTDFSLLNTKLYKDLSIISKELLPKTMLYLNNEQQVRYLRSIPINELFPSPPGTEWKKLLSSLGYRLNDDGGFTITRYVLPEPAARIHHQLIKRLITLPPIEPKVILEALVKIEAYVHNPKTLEDYQQFLNRIATDVVNKEYETGYFIINWINKLLRYLKIKPETPLHPYLETLVQVIKEEPLTIIPGTLMNILPQAKDHTTYKGSLSAYFESKIAEFWSRLPDGAQKKIVRDPIRFAALVHFLSEPAEHLANFFKALDKESLAYFNTAQGIQQLILDTPEFSALDHFPLLISAMKSKEIQFLEEIPSVIELLVDRSSSVFQQIAPFFPFQSDSRNDLLFQYSVLETLPKPWQKEHFTRFLQAYCTDASRFVALLITIYNSYPSLADHCWEQMPNSIWDQWFVKHPSLQMWFSTLKNLLMKDRLDFFEKLIKDEPLTASEFCEFLLEKNKEVFDALWNNIPKEQWTTWLEDNKLPSTTVSLLKLIPDSFKVEFFKDMRAMYAAKESLSPYFGPKKTIEQFYPKEVGEKIKEAISEKAEERVVSALKAKLSTLTTEKRNECSTNIQLLSEGINALNKNLKQLKQGWQPNFYKKTPYDDALKTIENGIKSIDELYEKTSQHPLFPTLKELQEPIKTFNQLIAEMQELSSQLNGLQDNPTIPSDLNSRLKELLEKLKKIQPLQSNTEIVINKPVISDQNTQASCSP